MLRVLTKEESDKSQREMDEWILNLDFNTKANFRRILENYKPNNIQLKHIEISE